MAIVTCFTYIVNWLPRAREIIHFTNSILFNSWIADIKERVTPINAARSLDPLYLKAGRKWSRRLTNFQGANKNTYIFVGSSTSAQNLLFCARILYMNNVKLFKVTPTYFGQCCQRESRLWHARLVSINNCWPIDSFLSQNKKKIVNATAKVIVGFKNIGLSKQVLTTTGSKNLNLVTF